MLRKTPLKTKTPLKAYTPLRAKTPLRSKSPLRAVSPKAEKPKDEQPKPKKKRRTEPNYVKDMDTVFQFYVRLRDVMPGGYGRCISCGKIKSFDHLQAGHYIGRRHMILRWNPFNCNLECDGCNGFDGNHLIGYRKNLIKKIGEAKVELIESIYKQSKKWSAFEIEAMIVYYGKLCLQLSASKKVPLSKGVIDIIKRYDKRSRTEKV